MSWVDKFLHYTNGINSPPLFRKWGAIALLAGAVERKLWITTRSGSIYPNLYVVLVAPPGVGKSEVTWRVRHFWSQLPSHHIAPSSVTKASLIDSLAGATRHIQRLNEIPSMIAFNSLLIASNELGVLLPAYDNEFMNVLTDLYDNKSYEETRRTKDLHILIKNPQINIIAACTPSYLNAMMPEGAWDQGFASRTIFIYSGEQVDMPLFGEADESELSDEEEALIRDLKTISRLYGKMEITDEAKQFLENWHRNKGEPRPDHPKLLYYNSRRTVHLIKLSMIAAVSRTQSAVIDLPDVQCALDWLIEAEHYMPEIFRSMSSNSSTQIVREIWHFVYESYRKSGGKPVPVEAVLNFTHERVPAQSVEKIIELMERGRLIERKVLDKKSGYVPREKATAVIHK